MAPDAASCHGCENTESEDGVAERNVGEGTARKVNLTNSRFERRHLVALLRRLLGEVVEPANRALVDEEWRRRELLTQTLDCLVGIFLGVVRVLALADGALLLIDLVWHSGVPFLGGR